MERRRAMGRGGVSLFVLCSAAAAFVGCNALREKLTPTEPTPAEADARTGAAGDPGVLTTPPTPAPTPTPAPRAEPDADTGRSPAERRQLQPAPEQQPQRALLDAEHLVPRPGGQGDHPGHAAAADIFDVNNKVCENCYYVKNQGKFTSAVIANLNAVGLCAHYDGEELAVKNSNSFNEQFDILLSSGHIRRGAGSYRATCQPSWF